MVLDRFKHFVICGNLLTYNKFSVFLSHRFNKIGNIYYKINNKINDACISHLDKGLRLVNRDEQEALEGR